jgi:enamine deaminase RidA (YjgF/YER057c/UK114 family)|tara:strand:- start:474 stop:971 length:498 start_codon:yes stop_codon:yes gene_type:complete
MIMRLSAFILWGFVLCAAFLKAAAQESTGNLNMAQTDTAAGSFYSSELSLQQNFPFSDVVTTTGGLVFISGLVGTDETGELVPGGLKAETHAIFTQMQAYLAHLNLDLTDVVKCLVMIDDIDQWGDFNGVYTSYFKPPYPARSAMGADGLALGASLELECIAVNR